jgi:hypothetical protein
MRSKNKASNSGHIRPDLLKDEVYRQMFRVEAGRPGAPGQLAVALLRAWMALDSNARTADRLWLRKICPLCIALLEASGDSVRPGTGCSV